jgi:Flp pilus assembly pilin Flp
MLDEILRKLHREEGQALVEYVLTVSLLGIFAIGALTLTGQSLSNILLDIANKV